jgi:excisionase family DNA binding protein
MSIKSNTLDVPNWIGLKQAMAILGISRNTLKGLVNDGILPAYTIEGVVGYRFRRPEVEALIKPVVPIGAATKKRIKSKHSPTRKTR